MNKIYCLTFLSNIKVLSSNIVKVRHYNSTLFVTGERAHKTVSVLTPHIDFDDQLKDIEKLRRNIQLRNLNISIDKLQELWQVLKDIDSNRVALERKRKEIYESIKTAEEIGNEKEITRLKVKAKLARDDLKVTTKALWGIQENVVLKILSLPNGIHSDVPSEDPKILKVFKECPQIFKDHIEIGKSNGLIRYCNPVTYYLENNLALCELKILNFFSLELYRNDFIQFSNPDFCHSIVIEGCGMLNSESLNTLQIESINTDVKSSKLHVVGGASLASFCAYHAKNKISLLPAKYACVGRQYKNVCSNDIDKGLFGVCQASAVELFIALNDDSSVDNEFDTALNIIISLYEKLGLHFRAVLVPAKYLHSWESMKVSIQMYSPKLKSYVEVGNLSNCGDYISKRLLMCYKANNDIKFLNIISGTVVSVPNLIGCILEQTEDGDMPSVLK